MVIERGIWTRRRFGLQRRRGIDPVHERVDVSDLPRRNMGNPCSGDPRDGGWTLETYRSSAGDGVFVTALATLSFPLDPFFPFFLFFPLGSCSGGGRLGS